MLEFWNTVRGARLADTLINALPKLAKEKEQYTIMDDTKDSCHIQRIINSEIEKGSKFVNSVYVGSSSIILIFEK